MGSMKRRGPPSTRWKRAAPSALASIRCWRWGVIPVLLGSLADEHRLSAQAIGLAAMAELLTMGVVTGLPAWCSNQRA